MSHSLVIMEAIRDDLRAVEDALTSASSRKIEASRERLESALAAIGHLERIVQTQPPARDGSHGLRLELVALGRRIREVRRLALEGESFCRGWDELLSPAGEAYTSAGTSREHDPESALVVQG